MKKKSYSKKYKVRSGKRILGTIQPAGSGTFIWEATAKTSTRDRGISGTRDLAVNNILKSNSGGGSAEGFRRQFDVSIED